MQELIKYIRTSLQKNQEQFASLLGTTAVTVNRWENGKTIPTTMAQKRLFEICQENDLDLAEKVVASVRADSNNLTFYHGSRTGIEGTIRPISRASCDFGQGFYMGTDPVQPLTLICSKKAPVFYTLEVDDHDLRILNVEADIDWAMLIAYYRGYMDEAKGTPIYEKYAHMADGADIITGYIANDRMYRVMTDFFEKRITDQALIGSLSALKLGKQYVAISQKACDRIRIVKERKLMLLELLALQEKSEVRRREGIALADRIVMEHRRDGLFFDEILQGVK